MTKKSEKTSALSAETLGIFVDKPIEKTITWESGGETHTHTTFIKKASFNNYVVDSGIVFSKELTQEQKSVEIQASRIADCVVNEDGSPVFANREQVKQLIPELASALTTAFYEVNPVEGKPSTK